MEPRRRGLLIGVAAGVAVLVLGGVAWAVVAALGGDPDSVQEVADSARDAAEDLDVDAGVRLLCSAPTTEERRDLEDLIATSQDRAGTDEPDVEYAVSDVEGDREGSFRVVVTSGEASLSDEIIALEVQVDTDGDRSCIAGAEPFDPTVSEQ